MLQVRVRHGDVRRAAVRVGRGPAMPAAAWRGLGRIAGRRLAGRGRGRIGDTGARNHIPRLLRLRAEQHVAKPSQRRVVHNDDTSMTVLALQRPGAPRGDPDDVSPDRTGVFTSGVVATREGRRIALFSDGPS